uniref:AP180 N-terminal homology (ANTH) domain-containing protein n=1 Tax=Oryza barthii TaxID=65489 RepID=A0A0D3H7Z2_9ORYZ
MASGDATGTHALVLPWLDGERLGVVCLRHHREQQYGVRGKSTAAASSSAIFPLVKPTAAAAFLGLEAAARSEWSPATLSTEPLPSPPVVADSEFWIWVFYATHRGTRMLNMSDFCDRSRTDAWDFSAFVRTYAAYLDDRLEYRMQAKHGGAARQGRPLREQLYASPGNRFNYDDFIMRDDEATNAEADKAMALVARETPTSEMTLEQLLAKAQLLLAPHCLLLPVAMVVVVLALEKKLLVVLAPHCLLLPVAMVVVVLALEKKLLVVVLGGALVEAGGVGGHQASRGEGIRAVVVVGDGEAIGVGRQLRLLPTIEMPMRP